MYAKGQNGRDVEPDDLVKWGTSLPGNLVNGPALNFFPTFLPAAEPREGSRTQLGPLRAFYLNARSFTHTQPRREKSSAERPRVRIFIPARLRPLSFDSPITDGRPLRSGRRRRCRPPRRRSCRRGATCRAASGARRSAPSRARPCTRCACAGPRARRPPSPPSR